MTVQLVGVLVHIDWDHHVTNYFNVGPSYSRKVTKLACAFQI